MKKFFAILLACALIFSAFPVVAFADVDAHDHAEIEQCHCDRDTRDGEYLYHVDADCVSVEYEVYKCYECGLTYTKTISAALGHDDDVKVVSPTCTEEGYTLYTCKRDNCPEKVRKDTIVPATGHNYDSVVTDPTCTEEGYTTHTCTKCGDVYKDAQTPALDHNYKSEVVAPTCNSKGYTVYTCTRCGKSYKDSWVPATGHNYVEDEKLDAECFENGYIKYICPDCGHSYTKILDAPMKHDYRVEEIPADCENPAKEQYICNLCGYGSNGEVIIDKEGSKPLGHKPSGIIKENEVAPDCINDGSYEAVVKCTVCDVEISRETVVVPATGHTKIVIDEAVEKTCTTDGLTEGSHCGICGAIISEQKVVPASHELVTIPAQIPSCSEIGWDEYQKCTECDYNEYVELPAVPSNHHNVTTKEQKYPTCMEDGWTREVKCDLCGLIIAYSKVDPSDTSKPEQHNVVKTVVDPTCTTEGYTEYKCANGCSDPAYNYVTDIKPALGHKYVDHEAQEVTCLEKGWNAYQTCERCDYSSYVEIDPLGHDQGESFGVVEATCAAGGYSIWFCNRCKEYYKDDFTDALEHKKVEIPAVEATCTETGLTAGEKCELCGEIFVKQEVVPAKGHTEQVLAAVAATCTTTGLTEGKKCSVCNEILVAQKVVPALGHKNGTAVKENEKAPTCTENGSYDSVVSCTVCGVEVSRTTVQIPALGHKEEKIPAVPATFDKTGLTEGKKCSVCGEILLKQEVIPALKEIIKFSYKATGKNGSSYATNSGEIVVEVWMTVTTEQARLWGIDLEVLFNQAEVSLIAAGCDRDNFPTFDCTKAETANANGSVKITLAQAYGVDQVITLAKGEYKVATLTFKVSKTVYDQNVEFNVNAGSFLVTRDEELTTKLPNELEITNGIDADKAEAIINVKLLGDVNGDGLINGKDTMKMADWAATSAEGSYDAVCDMDKNGFVDAYDLLDLAGAVVGNDEYLDK